MSLEHLEQLEQIKDEWEGSSFLSAMNITWTVRRLLSDSLLFSGPAQADPPDAVQDLSDILLSPAQADPVDEYLRLSALLSSYHRLYEAVRDGDSHVKVSPSPWIYFSKRGRACLAHYNTAAFGPSSASTWIRHREAIYAGRSPFTMINALLRQELVFATVDFQALRRPPLVDSGRIAGTMSIALRRAIDEVHRVPGLSDEQRARFEFAWGRTALAL